MNRKTLLALGAALAAGAAAVALLGKLSDPSEAEEPQPEAEPPFDPDATVAFPLRNKYADYSRGEQAPIYRFELETPAGVREVTVTEEQYNTCYIGDEVLCVEGAAGYEVV